MNHANESLPSDLETPSVLLDYSRLVRNIQWAQELAARHHAALRPHIKTHKCLEIARLQRAHGASGITASKTDEALIFIEAGFNSVTVAYPVIASAKLERLLAAARRHSTDLRMVVDSPAGLESLAAAAKRGDVPVRVYVEIDVGLHRCGLKEGDPHLVELVRRIAGVPMLSFAGLLSHAGQAYAANGPEEVRGVAREECAILNRVRRRLEGEGFRGFEVSVGSTPTVLASDSFEGLTELRPGNYVFMDLAPVRLGLVTLERIALSVLATVVSANDEFLIIDAGSKVLSSDRGAHGAAGAPGFGLAFALEDYETRSDPLTIERLSEEHGFVRRGQRDLKIGSRLRVIPNHACPVANLAESYMVLREQGEPDRWPIEARGRVL